MDLRRKAVWGLAALVIIVGGFALASYFFDFWKHREVVEMHPETPDIPGGALSSVTVLGSDEGKEFVKIREMRTKRLKEREYDLEVILNDEPFFKALAAAEGKGDRKWGVEERFHAYRDQYRLDRRLVFTVMIYSAAGHLFDYLIEKWMILRVDGGQEYEPRDWQESNRSSEYHRREIVTFARRDGEAILPSAAKAVELILRDPSGKSETILRWDLTARNDGAGNVHE